MRVIIRTEWIAALRCGGNGIEPEQRAGRHDDLAAMRAGELDQLGARQQRADAQHHDPFAGLEHRPADVLEHGCRRAFDREVGMARKILELDQRTRDPGLREPFRALAWSRAAAQASASPGIPAATFFATLRPIAPIPAIAIWFPAAPYQTSPPPLPIANPTLVSHRR